MAKSNNKDSRATVAAARKAARSRIISSIISAIAIIVVALIGIIFSNKSRVETENKKPNIIDSMRSVDTVEHEVTSITGTEQSDEPIHINESAYISDLKRIEHLINNQQYSQAFRAYLNLYNSLPISEKERLNQPDIEKAKDLYELGKSKNAALLMKECMEILL